MNTTLAALLSLLIASSSAKPNIPQDSKFLMKSSTTVLLNVPFVHQIKDIPSDRKSTVRGTACGPAVLTMAVNYLGDEKELIQVIEELPTTVYIKGDRFYNLYDGAKYLSKKTIRIKPNPKDIYQTLQKGYPVILNIQNYDGITGHAVLVVGILNFDGESADTLVVHDPYRAPYRKFEYINETQLKQPEGYYNNLGILEPFYIK